MALFKADGQEDILKLLLLPSSSVSYHMSKSSPPGCLPRVLVHSQRGKNEQLSKPECSVRVPSTEAASTWLDLYECYAREGWSHRTDGSVQYMLDQKTC